MENKSLELKYFIYNKDEDGEGFSSAVFPTSLEQAFDKSIEAWTLRAEGKNILNVLEACGLCNLFLKPSPTNTCEGCPIYLETGGIYCFGNVHYTHFKAAKITEISHGGNTASCSAAKAEVEWLIDLKKKYVIGAISYKARTTLNLADLQNKIIDEFTRELSEGTLYRASSDKFINEANKIFAELKVDTNGVI